MLKELIITNNAIGPAACVCICVGIRECLSLKYVCLDGNVLGEFGARALVSLPLSRADDLVVSSQGCDLVLKEDACWFNYKGDIFLSLCFFLRAFVYILMTTEPEGIYTLDMSVGYDRAAFFEMLRVLAWEPIFSFSVCESSEDGKTWRKRNIVRYLEDNAALTEEEIDLLKNMKEVKRIAESRELLVQLFQVCVIFIFLLNQTLLIYSFFFVIILSAEISCRRFKHRPYERELPFPCE